MFLQSGLKLSILEYEKKKYIYEVITRSLSLTLTHGRCREAVAVPSPLDGTRCPSQRKGSLQVLLKGRTGCFFCMVQIWWQQPQITESYQLSNPVELFLSEALLWYFNHFFCKEKKILLNMSISIHFMNVSVGSCKCFFSFCKPHPDDLFRSKSKVILLNLCEFSVKRKGLLDFLLVFKKQFWQKNTPLVFSIFKFLIIRTLICVLSKAGFIQDSYYCKWK